MARFTFYDASRLYDAFLDDPIKAAICLMVFFFGTFLVALIWSLVWRKKK